MKFVVARAAAALFLLAPIAACGASPSARVEASAPGVPNPVVPEQIGDLRFRREPSVESRLGTVGNRTLLRSVQVFTAANGNDVVGYLELGEFKSDFPATRPEVRQGVLSSLGGGQPEPVKIGDDVVFAKQGANQRFIIWFPPGGRYFQVLVASPKLDNPEALFAAILQSQRGGPADLDAATVERYDPRRGGRQ